MNERLLKIYIKNFIHGELNFNGIKLIPEIVDVNNYSNQQNSLELYWKIENPNNLSYFGESIKNFIVNSIGDFYNLAGMGEWSYDTHREIENKYANFTDINSSEIYISKKLSSEIKKSIMESGNFRFDNWSSDYKILNYYIGSNNNDSITIESDIKFFNSINPQTNEKIERDEIREMLDKMDRNSYLPEFSDKLLSQIVELVWNDERLCDRDTMFIDTIPTFFDEYGNII